MANETAGEESRKSGPFSFWNNLKLWHQILIALVAGLVVGALWGPGAEAIKPIGTVFISLIKMLIVPLVFSSLVVGVCSMEDTKKMGRIGLKSFVLYLATTAIAITIGLIVGTVLQPGVGIDMQAATAVTAKEAPGFIDTLVGIVPKNPVGAMSAGNILQIIVFAIMLGIAINLAGERAAPVKAVFESFAEIMYKLTHMVMVLAPYGVFALMAWVAGKFGLDVLLPLGKVIIGVYLACILHVLLTLTGGGIMLLGRLNPVRYLRGSIDAQAVAFTTTSSSGTLPVTISCARENLGVSKGMSSFVLPLGATINMDGTALYQGVAALFVAQAFGIDLGTGDYITIILTSTLASIGTAGVPGAGLIMLSWC